MDRIAMARSRLPHPVIIRRSLFVFVFSTFLILSFPYFLLFISVIATIAICNKLIR